MISFNPTFSAHSTKSGQKIRYSVGALPPCDSAFPPAEEGKDVEGKEDVKGKEEDGKEDEEGADTGAHLRSAF